MKLIENFGGFCVWLGKMDKLQGLDCFIGYKVWNFENNIKKKYFKEKMAPLDQ